VFVQFWARPPVAEKLQELVDRARVVVPDAKPKEILEDLILHAK
jgi:hypothetical protein